jgi:GT2 family glycosyltransferase
MLTTDPTKPMAQSAMKAIMETTPKPFELIVDHVSANEFGFSNGINRMVRGARGQNIILINDDCIPPPGWVERLLDAADEPEVGIVGGLPKVASSNFVAFGLVLIKEDVFKRIGGLDERFRLGHEDEDFCLRAMKAGFTIRHVDVAAVHLKNTSSRTLRATALRVRGTITFGVDQGYSPFRVVAKALWVFSYNLRYAARSFPLAMMLRKLKRRL